MVLARVDWDFVIAGEALADKYVSSFHSTIAVVSMHGYLAGIYEQVVATLYGPST